MAPQTHHHRSTLKQSNKSFKSKHSSKGSLKAAAKGKIGPSSSGTASKAADPGSKKVRIHRQSQKRDAQRLSDRESIKFFSTSSGGGNVPRVISIVPLLASVSASRFVRGLLPCLGLSDAEIEKITQKLGDHVSLLIPAPRFKTTILLNVLRPLDLYPTLDTALVSDTVILLLSSRDEVQLEGESVLRCLQGQIGIGNVISCVQAPDSKPPAAGSRSLINKSLLSFSQFFFPTVTKVYSTDTFNDFLILSRTLCESLPSKIRHPEGRSWIVASGEDAVTWCASDNDDGTMDQRGQLQVTGTVRGGCMSANRLVHLPGYGDFQVVKIIKSSISLKSPPTTSANRPFNSQFEVTSYPDLNADDLTAQNVPDLFANEQTWPTEEELHSAPAATGLSAKSSEKHVKRVPKGTSAYQAAWIFEDDIKDKSDNEIDIETDWSQAQSGRNVAEAMQQEITSPHGTERSLDGDEMEEVELDSRGDGHRDLLLEDEELQYESYLHERERAHQEDTLFPDEIDTPRNINARIRFQRYRGLRSFRTSPWDPYENLPLDYGEIFQFENFIATQKRVEQEARDEGIEVGSRVDIVIKDVPRSVFANRKRSSPFIVHGLLRHEHKQTVLHFAMQRNTEFRDPVPAKDPLILCVGPRRYIIEPIFSQHVRGGSKGVNNVHKSEKFLRHGAASVVSTYGPACFGKAPCLLLRDRDDEGVPDLVAMGSFLSSDPTRVIAKRIILTGHPFKVHKKTATIRYMFFNREDVSYFQSVELHTKYGRVGHIKEALGTHGYFKAHFDGPVQQMDTVCMSLYKRQFPKWSVQYSSSRHNASADSRSAIVIE